MRCMIEIFVLGKAVSASPIHTSKIKWKFLTDFFLIVLLCNFSKKIAQIKFHATCLAKFLFFFPHLNTKMRLLTEARSTFIFMAAL